MSAKQRPPRRQPRVRFCLGCFAEVNVKRRRAFPFLCMFGERFKVRLRRQARWSSCESLRMTGVAMVWLPRVARLVLVWLCVSLSDTLRLERVLFRRNVCSVDAVGVCAPRVEYWASRLRWQREVSVSVFALFASACLTDLLSDSLSASHWDLPTQIGRWELPTLPCMRVSLY